MTRILFIILISINSLFCFGQSNSDSSEISIWTPPSWFAGNKNLLSDNLKNYKLSQAENNISFLLGVYYKYDPKVHVGFIPTIKFYIRQNKIKDFKKFFISAKEDVESIKSHVTNFKYIDTPKTILAGQHKAFYTSLSYELKIQTGEIANMRVKIIYIPFDNKRLEVTLIDSDEEDCSNLYKEIINKIKVE